ncbi:hypothetical protein DZS_35390 [Dickeya ananatis]
MTANLSGANVVRHDTLPPRRQATRRRRDDDYDDDYDDEYEDDYDEDDEEEVMSKRPRKKAPLAGVAYPAVPDFRGGDVGLRRVPRRRNPQSYRRQGMATARGGVWPHGQP